MIQLIDPKRQAELEDIIAELSATVSLMRSRLSNLEQQNSYLEGKIISISRKNNVMEDQIRTLRARHEQYASGGYTGTSDSMSEKWFGRPTRDEIEGYMTSSIPRYPRLRERGSLRDGAAETTAGLAGLVSAIASISPEASIGVRQEVLEEYDSMADGWMASYTTSSIVPDVV